MKSLMQFITEGDVVSLGGFRDKDIPAINAHVSLLKAINGFHSTNDVDEKQKHIDTISKTLNDVGERYGKTAATSLAHLVKAHFDRKFDNEFKYHTAMYAKATGAPVEQIRDNHKNLKT